MVAEPNPPRMRLRYTLYAGDAQAMASAKRNAV